MTTTDLRTKSSDLVNSLKKGATISLIHRSRVIGEIRPKTEAKPFTKEDIMKLRKIVADLNLPKTSYKKREEIYRKHMMDKYGKYLP